MTSKRHGRHKRKPSKRYAEMELRAAERVHQDIAISMAIHKLTDALDASIGARLALTAAMTKAMTGLDTPEDAQDQA